MWSPGVDRRAIVPICCKRIVTGSVRKVRVFAGMRSRSPLIDPKCVCEVLAVRSAVVTNEYAACDTSVSDMTLKGRKHTVPIDMNCVGRQPPRVHAASNRSGGLQHTLSLGSPHKVVARMMCVSLVWFGTMVGALAPCMQQLPHSISAGNGV